MRNIEILDVKRKMKKMNGLGSMKSKLPFFTASKTEPRNHIRREKSADKIGYLDLSSPAFLVSRVGHRKCGFFALSESEFVVEV